MCITYVNTDARHVHLYICLSLILSAPFWAMSTGNFFCVNIRLVSGAVGINVCFSLKWNCVFLVINNCYFDSHFVFSVKFMIRIHLIQHSSMDRQSNRHEIIHMTKNKACLFTHTKLSFSL